MSGSGINFAINPHRNLICRCTNMKAPSLKHWTVQTLYYHLRKRAFAVPKLQRNFVWDARRTAKLLDSIYKRMPIGSLFLWEMNRKSANLIRQAANVLPAFDDRNKTIWFVIDGQQRLSVLYRAFAGQKCENDAGQEIDFDRLSFVVKPPNSNGEPAARIAYRKPRGREMVPVRDILAVNWRRLMTDVSSSQRFINTVKDCRERLSKYVLPVVIIKSATLEEIGEVFVRVNSQGMRITSADRAVAVMGRLDVNDMARQLRQTLRDSRFGSVGIDPILMGFNLVAERLDAEGDPPKLDIMARRWARAVEKHPKELTRFKKHWARYKKAFLAAAQYIRDHFPVSDATYLPSANMLATLAVFFYHHSGQPTGRQAKEIKKWFWATGVAKRYSGAGYHKNIVLDTILFRELARGRNRHFTLHERLDPSADIALEQYNASSAVTRAFFGLLAKQKPRYLDNGDPIALDRDIISPASARHRHHIFPRAQLNAVVSRKAYNSLSNVCLLVSADNESIGKKLPRRYLAECRDNGCRNFKTVMKSHLIPVQNGSGVWQRNVRRAFRQFSKERLKLICTAFEKEAGMKLFQRN